MTKNSNNPVRIYLLLSLKKGKNQPPLNLQLYDSFVRLIKEEKLKAGDRLPSSRILAKELKIARVTVTAAYKRLIEEGFCVSQTGSGTRINSELSLRETKNCFHFQPIEAKKKRISSRISNLNHPVSLRIQESKPFALCAPDNTSLPGLYWTRIVSRLSKSPWMHNGYSEPGGYEPFKQAVADYVRRVRCIACDSSQVIPTNGIQQGINLCSQVLFNSGESIAVEDPYFQLHISALEYHGFNVVPISTENNEFVNALLKLPQSVRGALLTPNHHFPLGGSFSDTEREKILSWAQESGAWLIENDYDSDLLYSGEPKPALFASDDSESVVLVGTFSKIIYPGLQLGYLICPRSLSQEFQTAKLLTDRHVSEVHQTILSEFIRNGDYEAHVRRLKKIYSGRRKSLVSALELELKEFGTVVPDNQGTHVVFLLGPMFTNDVDVVNYLKNNYQIEAQALSTFYRKNKAQCGLLLGFAHFHNSKLAKSVMRLKEALYYFLMTKNPTLDIKVANAE